MAQQGVLLDQDQFCCSICLDLLKEPVTIPCGHSYCSSCIKGCWDQEDLKGVYSCPQCKQTFTPRPTLRKSNMLADVVEKLKTEPHILINAGPGDVACDFCTERKQKALMSCLRQLGMSQQDVQQRVQEKDKELKELQQAVETFKHSADTAVEDSERIFTELIRSIERRRSEIKELIRAQQSAAVSQAERLLEQLEQEIAELRRRHAEMEQLSHTEDHIHFLQSYQSLSSVSPDLPSILISPLLHFGDVSESMSKLKVKLEDILTGELPEISTTVNAVGVLLPPEPKTRTWFLQYFRQLTLDPNTANKFLSLSKKKRKVTFTREVQPYPDHPERFTGLCQVLCKGGLSGHCYWEVEWTGQSLYIAVSYKNISKTGYNNDTAFGCNERSWCLEYSNGEYWLRHNNVKTKVSGSRCSRVGVYQYF